MLFLESVVSSRKKKKKTGAYRHFAQRLKGCQAETRAVLKNLESAEFVGAGFPANEKVRQGKDNMLGTKKGGNYFGKKKMKKVFRFFKPKKRSAWFLRRVLTSSKPPQTRMVRNKKVVPFFCLNARVPFRLPVQPLPRPRSSDLDPKASSIGLRPPRLPRWTDAASRHVTHLTVPRINQGLAIDVIARVLYVYVCVKRTEIFKDFRRRIFPIFQRRLHLISTLQTPLNARPPFFFFFCMPTRCEGGPKLEKVGWHARDTYINKDIKTRAHGAAARRRRDETTRRGARGTRGLTSRAVRNEGVAWLPSRRSLRYRAGRALAFTPTQAGRLPCGGIVTERERQREQ